MAALRAPLRQAADGDGDSPVARLATADGNGFFIPSPDLCALLRDAVFAPAAAQTCQAAMYTFARPAFGLRHHGNGFFSS